MKKKKKEKNQNSAEQQVGLTGLEKLMKKWELEPSLLENYN